MSTSPTRDWELKVYPLVEHIIDTIIIPNPLVRYEDDVDGELASALEDLLCQLFEAIEERSTFCADTDLFWIIKQVTEKSSAELLQKGWT